MAFGKPKSRISPIGIDFGADSLKLLQIVPGDAPELVALGSATVPEEARSNAQARQEFLNEALPALMRKHAFKNRRVMLSIPAFQTLVHNFEIPKVQPEEVDGQIDLMLRERLGIEPNRMVIRNYPGQEVTRAGKARQEVVTLAAGREVVMRYVDLANRHKLEVVGMHGEASCVIRAFDANTSRDPQDRQRPIAYVDLGAATTKVVVAHGSQMVLAKTIHAGGDQWTRQWANQRSVEFAEARMMRHAEATGGGASTATATALVPSKAGESYSCETLDSIVDELRLTLRHHNSRYPENPVQKLIFVGGEAACLTTCRTLASAMNVAAQLGDPFARMSRMNAGPTTLGVDLSEPQPGWAVPLGLCLSEANL